MLLCKCCGLVLVISASGQRQAVWPMLVASQDRGDRNFRKVDKRMKTKITTLAFVCAAAIVASAEVTSGQEAVAKAAPREMKLMIASFGTINSQAEVENWLGDQLRPNENLEQLPTLSEADKVADATLAAAVVRVTWHTQKIEYMRAARDIQQENARRMRILTNLKTSMLSDSAQRYTQLGREYLQSRLHKKVGKLIKVVDRGNMTIQQTEKAIKGGGSDMQNGADCILSVVMGDREEDSQTIPIDNSGTKIKRTTYTAPYVGKIRDLDGNVLLSFDDTAEWKCTQDNVVKSKISDPARKLMESVCDKIADKIAAFFTTELSFNVKAPKGMDSDDVEIYVDGREVDSDGVRVLSLEHIVKGVLDGCKPVKKIVEIDNDTSKKTVKLNFKAKKAEAADDADDE